LDRRTQIHRNRFANPFPGMSRSLLNGRERRLG
jgi:hypothetical protein